MKTSKKTLLAAFLPTMIGLFYQLMQRFNLHFSSSIQRFLASSERFSWIFWICLFGGIAVFLSMLLKRTDASDVPADTAVESVGQFLKTWKIEIGILIVTAFSLSMLIDSGYYWDDAVNSTVYLFEKYDDLPLLQNVLIFMRKYIELGRINVLSFYYYFLFYIENVSIYKAIIILLILADQIFFRFTLLEMGSGKRFARSCMLLIPMLIQTRAYQDPVNGFYGLMQIILAELLLTVFFLFRFLHTGKTRHLVFSLLPFFIGLMTYEVCFPFILMIPLLIFLKTRDWKRTIRVTLPYGIMVLLLLCAVIIVRINMPQETTYAGVAFSLDLSAIVRTWLYQTTASLPLSFYTAGKEFAIAGTSTAACDALHYELSDFLAAITAGDWLLLFLSAGLLLSIWKSEGKNSQSEVSGGLVGLGLCLWFLPTITIALSQRYQGQLMWGLGYLPVYMQYFGVAILIAAGIFWMCGHISPAFTTVIKSFSITAFVVILALNLQNNRSVTNRMNQAFYYPRNAGEAALDEGLLDFLPTDAVLLSANPGAYIWEANWADAGLYSEYYQIHSGFQGEVIGPFQFLEALRKTSVVNNDVMNEEDKVRIHPDNNLYLIAYDGDARRGLAKLGKVESVTIDTQLMRIEDAVVSEVLYFIADSVPEQDGILLTTSDGGLNRIAAGQGERVRKDKGGVLFQLPKDMMILFDSLVFSDF